MLYKLKATLKLIVALATGSDDLTINELRLERDLSVFESVKKSIEQTQSKIIENRLDLNEEIVAKRKQIEQLEAQIGKNEYYRDELSNKFHDAQDKLDKLEDIT